MKTIKQIADEIGVSKQAIFYRIKKPPLSNTLRSLTSKENGVLMVSFDGERLIKQAFNIETVKTFDDKEPSKENSLFDSVYTTENEIIKILQSNIDVFKQTIVLLENQLKIKDKQIEELTATIKTQAESINADRKNELASTIITGQKMLDDNLEQDPKTASDKKSLFNFFRKNQR